MGLRARALAVRTLVVYILPMVERRFLGCVHRFAASYRDHRAGADHDLVLVGKHDEREDAFHLGDVFALSWPVHRVEDHSNDGFDIGSTQRLARERPDYDVIVQLSAYARILTDRWLEKLTRPLGRPEIGMVSSRGSFEAGVTGRFPNPHLGTGVFATRPELLTQMPQCETKRDTLEFEHGDRSFYRTLAERQLAGVVVDRDGVAYGQDAWFHSATFRSGGQTGLLVADNQTDSYAQAGPEERADLERRAWGTTE